MPGASWLSRPRAWRSRGPSSGCNAPRWAPRSTLGSVSRSCRPRTGSPSSRRRCPHARWGSASQMQWLRQRLLHKPRRPLRRTPPPQAVAPRSRAAEMGRPGGGRTVPTVHVVGLGPGDVDLVTVGTMSLLGSVSPQFVRTRRHPAASLLDGAPSFDRIYDTADSIDEVYPAIVEELVAAARHAGEVLYAVPGSPLVAEHTVELLLADDRVRTVATPGAVVPGPDLGAPRCRPGRARCASGRRPPVRGGRGRGAGAVAGGAVRHPFRAVRHQALGRASHPRSR